MNNAQQFYLDQGRMNATGAEAETLRTLPHDLGALCAVVQGVLIHRDIAPWLYELKLSEEQRDYANLRTVREVLSLIRARDTQPIARQRDPAARLPCVCSHFSNLLCAILRERGVPARARCGFGAYFTPGRFEDHWVAEYWNESQKRWVLVDAQIDSIQRAAFKLDFDPLDVPHNRFVIAGDAWQMCREGRADPNLFGLSFLKEQGMWWIGANLIRDLASLNLVPMLPWDVWGIMHKPEEPIPSDEELLLDRVAELTLAGDEALSQLQEIYKDERLEVPDTVFNANRQRMETL